MLLRASVMDTKMRAARAQVRLRGGAWGSGKAQGWGVDLREGSAVECVSSILHDT